MNTIVEVEPEVEAEPEPEAVAEPEPEAVAEPEPEVEEEEEFEPAKSEVSDLVSEPEAVAFEGITLHIHIHESNSHLLHVD